MSKADLNEFFKNYGYVFDKKKSAQCFPRPPNVFVCPKVIFIYSCGSLIYN